MQIIINAAYDAVDGTMDVSVEGTVIRDDVDANGNPVSVVLSPELAYFQLIRDIAMGIIDPTTRGFWDTPINIISEYEAYHRSAAREISSGRYGGNVSSS